MINAALTPNGQPLAQRIPESGFGSEEVPSLVVFSTPGAFAVQQGRDIDLWINWSSETLNLN